MYDAIVVGARCGGSPTALLLAHRGYRVLLLDRASFPSDAVSAHHVTVPGVARLARWGLLEAVAASGCPPIRSMTVRLGDHTFQGTPASVDGIGDQYCVRRTILDTILVDAAAEAGAEVREGFVVEELLFDGDRVAGVRGREPGGGDVVERAQLVVGADGLHSLVAEWVDAPVYASGSPLTCCSYAYWSGVDLAEAEIHAVGGRAVSAFPTNDGLVCVSVQWPASEAPAFRAAIEANFVESLTIAPAVRDRLATGARVRPFVTTTDLPTFFRTPHGPGWALVGDAGRHRDPFLAHGIADAFRDAELLAGAIDAGLAGEQPLDEALARFEHDRNRTALPSVEFTSRLATLRSPDAEMLPNLSTIDDNPDQIDRILGVLTGSVPVSEVFDFVAEKG
ncbi:MAG: NAD(P)/FAD-dependent oxidoreductase [Actinobacteria bacterium]|nr:NAD(P)/FAD-dependent oxidoreductase [Actinomycetota bacterium]